MSWEGDRGQERKDKLGLLREDARVVGDNEVPFGAIRKGFAGDIIATSGDLEDLDLAVSADSINFVMKSGRIFKRDGSEQL